VDGLTLAEDRQAISIAFAGGMRRPGGTQHVFGRETPEEHGGSALGDGGSRIAHSGRVTASQIGSASRTMPKEAMVLLRGAFDLGREKEAAGVCRGRGDPGRDYGF
jgi:hypothetical protein